jgi:hypothetical protein
VEKKEQQKNCGKNHKTMIIIGFNPHFLCGNPVESFWEIF